MIRLYFSYRIAVDIFVSFAFAALYQYMSMKFPEIKLLGDNKRFDFLVSIMGIAGSMLGLVLAASSFLIVHVRDERFELLRRSRGWKQFPALVSSNLWRLFTLTALSGFAVFTPKEFQDYLLIFIIALSIACLITLAALIWVVGKVMAIPESI